MVGHRVPRPVTMPGLHTACHTPAMDLTFVGWIVVGLIAGLFSGVVAGGGSDGDALATPEARLADRVLTANGCV